MYNPSVVGYQGNAVPKGKAMVTPTFTTVSGENMPVDSFACVDTADLDAMIQVVNADGTWGKKAFWFNAFEDIPAGWCEDEGGLIPSDIVLTPGQAVFFSAQKEGGSIQSSGSVPLTDVLIPLPKGKSMIGNVSTVTIPVDKMQLDGVADLDAMIQVVNADGTWGKKAFWFNAFEDIPAGWCEDEGGLIPSDIELTPGQSVFFSAQKEGGVAHIPSAVTK